MSMTVSEAIAARRATRRYSAQQPSDALIEQVARAALEAPSAFNAQRAELVVVTDPKVKEGIFAASGQAHLRDAPVLFITVALAGVPEDLVDTLGEQRAEYVRGYFEGLDPAALRETALKDAMLVAGFVLLAAQGAGLVTSPTTGWDEAGVLEAIGLGGRKDRAVGLVVAAGFPDETPAHPGRVKSRLRWLRGD